MVQTRKWCSARWVSLFKVTCLRRVRATALAQSHLPSESGIVFLLYCPGSQGHTWEQGLFFWMTEICRWPGRKSWHIWGVDVRTLAEWRNGPRQHSIPGLFAFKKSSFAPRFGRGFLREGPMTGRHIQNARMPDLCFFWIVKRALKHIKFLWGVLLTKIFFLSK